MMFGSDENERGIFTLAELAELSVVILTIASNYSGRTVVRKFNTAQHV